MSCDGIIVDHVGKSHLFRTCLCIINEVKLGIGFKDGPQVMTKELASSQGVSFAIAMYTSFQFLVQVRKQIYTRSCEELT